MKVIGSAIDRWAGVQWMAWWILPPVQRPASLPQSGCIILHIQMVWSRDPKYVKTRGRDPKYIKTRGRDPKYIKALLRYGNGGALVQDL